MTVGEDQGFAAARLEILANASRVFSEAAADVRTPFDRIARHVAEVLRDACVIRLLSADGRRFEEPVGSWDVDPAFRELLRGTPAVASSEAIGPEMLRGGEPVVMLNADPRAVAERVAPSPRREVLEQLAIHSVLIVPMRARGELMGILSVCRRREGTLEPFAEDDLRLLQELADRAALVVSQWRALDELQAAVAARDEFLSIASHELRTPLTALGLQLERLKKLLVPITRVEGVAALDRLEVALRQTARLDALIEGLLNVSSIVSGRLQLHPEPFDLRALVIEIIDRLAELACKTSCEIRLDAEEPIVGSWDRGRLDVVVMNLLGNALKYGRGEAVEVGLQRRAEHVELSVRDHGIGISEADQKRIFSRFERAVPTEHYGGLGLGLYIARQIVEAHGGTVEVESAPGCGATFRVRLPIASAARISGAA